MLEILHFIQQKKSLGSFSSDLSVSESEIKIVNHISEIVDMPTLILFWQFILKGLEEISIVSNPILSLEMLIVRLIHLKGMPTYEKVLESLGNENMSLVEADSTKKNQSKLI